MRASLAHAVRQRVSTTVRRQAAQALLRRLPVSARAPQALGPATELAAASAATVEASCTGDVLAAGPSRPPTQLSPAAPVARTALSEPPAAPLAAVASGVSLAPGLPLAPLRAPVLPAGRGVGLPLPAHPPPSSAPPPFELAPVPPLPSPPAALPSSRPVLGPWATPHPSFPEVPCLGPTRTSYPSSVHPGLLPMAGEGLSAFRGSLDLGATSLLQPCVLQPLGGTPAAFLAPPPPPPAMHVPGMSAECGMLSIPVLHSLAEPPLPEGSVPLPFAPAPRAAELPFGFPPARDSFLHPVCAYSFGADVPSPPPPSPHIVSGGDALAPSPPAPDLPPLPSSASSQPRGPPSLPPTESDLCV